MKLERFSICISSIFYAFKVPKSQVYNVYFRKFGIWNRCGILIEVKKWLGAPSNKAWNTYQLESMPQVINQFHCTFSWRYRYTHLIHTFIFLFTDFYFQYIRKRLIHISFTPLFASLNFPMCFLDKLILRVRWLP